VRIYLPSKTVFHHPQQTQKYDFIHKLVFHQHLKLSTMKSYFKLYLAIAAFLFAHASFSQTKKNSIAFTFGNAPHDFKIGWYEVDAESFDDYDVEKYSYSLGLKVERSLSANINVRLRASYLHIKFHEYHDDEVQYRDALSTQRKFQLAPGVIFPFTRDRVTIYGGLEAIAYFHGEVETLFKFTNKLFPDSHPNQSRSTIPSGFTAGAAPLMGFNFNLSKSIFIEAEFSMLMTYGTTGGETETNQEGFLVTTQDLSKGMFTEPRISFGAGFRF
jgi:hypothetical protein